MAQDPARAGKDCDRGTVGDFCAGGTAGIDHRGRGTRAHLQAGGSAALSRAGCGDHARTDGGRAGGAGVCDAVAGEFLQLSSGEVHAARVAGSGGRPEDAGGAGGGHAAVNAAGQGDSDFFAAVEGGDPAAVGAEGADDFVFESARIFDIAAMSVVRVCGGVSELQRVADVSSAGAEAGVSYLRPCGVGAGGVSEHELPESADTVRRTGDGEGGGHADEIVSGGAGEADGFGHAAAEGGLPAGAGGFPDGEDRYFGGDADDCEGAAFSERDAGGDCVCGPGAAHGGFPGVGADISV